MRVKKYPNKQKNSTEIYNYSAVKDAKIHLVTRANGFSSIDQTAASLWFPDPRSGRNWGTQQGACPVNGNYAVILDAGLEKNEAYVMYEITAKRVACFKQKLTYLNWF